jgi:hypothetical protein
MSKRKEMLKEYLAGFQSMDPERSLRAAAPDFYILDGALEVPVSRARFPEYMLGWDERMKAIGGTGSYEVSDEVVQDLNDCLLRWAWWKFIGTEIEGSALVKVTDGGVAYAKFAYYKIPGA